MIKGLFTCLIVLLLIIVYPVQGRTNDCSVIYEEFYEEFSPAGPYSAVFNLSSSNLAYTLDTNVSVAYMEAVQITYTVSRLNRSIFDKIEIIPANGFDLLVKPEIIDDFNHFSGESHFYQEIYYQNVDNTTTVNKFSFTFKAPDDIEGIGVSLFCDTKINRWIDLDSMMISQEEQFSFWFGGKLLMYNSMESTSGVNASIKMANTINNVDNLYIKPSSQQVINIPSGNDSGKIGLTRVNITIMNAGESSNRSNVLLIPIYNAINMNTWQEIIESGNSLGDSLSFFLVTPLVLSFACLLLSRRKKAGKKLN
ncbi:MAG: hypothetical protein ACTSP4_12790 [Candidatus Hodarchaeales archaeon]